MMKFELPYNYYLDYEGKLSQVQYYWKYIKYIYLPTFMGDGDTTRWNTSLTKGFPKTYDDYIKRLYKLQSLGLPLCILLQRNGTMELVDKYYNLGIRYFIITDDELASKIKMKYQDVYLTLSITRALTLDDILTTDLSMYDDIVLFFWFNRHLDVLKELPTKYKYVLMVNNFCYYNCTMHDRHWFAKSMEELENVNAACHATYKLIPRNKTKVEPSDLGYFEPYVSSYKLVDRIFTTDQIVNDLIRYSNRDMTKPMHARDWYNIDVPDCDEFYLDKPKQEDGVWILNNNIC